MSQSSGKSGLLLRVKTVGTAANAKEIFGWDGDWDGDGWDGDGWDGDGWDGDGWDGDF